LFGVIIADQYPRLSKSFQIRNIRNLAQASLVNTSGAFYFTSVGASGFVYCGSLSPLGKFTVSCSVRHKTADEHSQIKSDHTKRQAKNKNPE